jgi:phenylacetate-CoA ligase
MPDREEPRYYNPAVERLSREELKRLQLHKLQQTVRWAYERSAFYRDKFRRAGVTPDHIKSFEHYRELVPVTTKQELLLDQDAQPPLGTRIAVPQSEIVRYYTTSGTSGLGQEVHALSRRDLEYTSTWAYGFHWAGVEPGDLFGNTMPKSSGNLAGPDTVVTSAARHGMNMLLLGVHSTEERLRWMQRFGADFLYTAPSYLNRLTSAARELDINPAGFGLKGIMVGSEAYPRAWAVSMQDIWGTVIHEMYGSTTTLSCVAFSAEEGVAPAERAGLMRVLEHLVHVDVIDPETGAVAGDGEDGEIIVTPLERHAMPILRFQTGDRITHISHKHAPCGRPFDCWSCGDVRRYDDMLKIRTANIWPTSVDGVMFSEQEVAEYQAEVLETGTGTAVRVQVEFHADVAAKAKAGLLAALTAQLRATTGVSMSLREAGGELPRFELKARRWTDRRAEGLTALATSEVSE